MYIHNIHTPLLHTSDIARFVVHLQTPKEGVDKLIHYLSLALAP